MKRLSLIVVCAIAALFFASCQTGKREDKNGNTPSDVVDSMYVAIQNKDFVKAASYNKLPDTIKMKEKNVYPDFKSNSKKDDKIIITREEWSKFVVGQMDKQGQDEEFELVSWEIVSEEISKTDPNSAKVKTKIQISTKNGKSEAECSFPLKREDDVWKIIG